MSGILKRGLAPIDASAWRLIDEQAARILKGNLSARALVDFRGPLGPAAASVNLGGIGAVETEVVPGVAWGRRAVLPLVEIDVPFTLSLCELDDVVRGGQTPDLTAVTLAAQRAALFEEKALYHGLPAQACTGLLEATPHKPLPLPRDPAAALAAFESAVVALQTSGIGGPYQLVLGSDAYSWLAVADTQGYPLRARVSDLLDGGGIRWSPALPCGALVSSRGGDAELTVGQDFAVGFAGTEGDQVHLRLCASFAFRVLEPLAAVALKAKG